MPIFLAGTSRMKLTQYPGHKHDHYEVILNIDGEGISIIGEGKYPFAPGTIHIIPPNVIHKKESELGFRDIYFVSNSTLFHDYFALQYEPVVLHDDKEHTLHKLMTIIVSRFQKQKRHDPILESTHQAALQQINEWHEKITFDLVIDDIISHIDSSFNDPDFTVTDALTATGYNTDYIRRRFHAIMGTTPNTYLTNQRIKYAKHLLLYQRQLNLSVSEIASLSGYYDVCYFSRLFKKKEGISPTEYAARNREQG